MVAGGPPENHRRHSWQRLPRFLLCMSSRSAGATGGQSRLACHRRPGERRLPCARSPYSYAQARTHAANGGRCRTYAYEQGGFQRDFVRRQVAGTRGFGGLGQTLTCLRRVPLEHGRGWQWTPGASFRSSMRRSLWGVAGPVFSFRRGIVPGLGPRSGVEALEAPMDVGIQHPSRRPTAQSHFPGDTQHDRGPNDGIVIRSPLNVHLLIPIKYEYCRWLEASSRQQYAAAKVCSTNLIFTKLC